MEQDKRTTVQIMDEAVCISLSTNALTKLLNPTILPPAMDKEVRQTGGFNLGLEKGKWNSNQLNSI